MGYGYLILLLAVTFITYVLFEKRMVERAKDLAKKHGRRRGAKGLPNYKLANRAYIIGVLVVWVILASVALVSGGTFWVILAAIATIACAGYILWCAYHAKDSALISALTYLIWPFGTFVFCIIANAIRFPGGLIAGFIAAIVIALLPRVAFLQGFYDSMNQEYE